MENSEERLISDILAGNADAYGILVERYQRPIFNLMLRMTSNKEDALDLAQDTFVRAYEKLERYKPPARFFPWLYTIGMNLARDFCRKQKCRQTGSVKIFDAREDSDSTIDPGSYVVERLDSKRVEKALEGLPLDYREAVILRFHEDLSMKEIAVSLGISVSGAKMRIHRGLLRLRHILTEGNLK